MWPVDPLDRVCTQLSDDNHSDAQNSADKRITVRELARIPVFVLLGEPGMGKSKTMEALRTLSKGSLLTANDLLSGAHLTAGADNLVLIDALDEARADGGTTVWREVRKQINERGLQRFAIACRSADWHSHDKRDLDAGAPGRNVEVFALEPLSVDQQRDVLMHLGVTEPTLFQNEIERLGLDAMLGNPHTLGLLAAARSPDGTLPSSRRDAYEKACLTMVQESNPQHQRIQTQRRVLSDQELLNAAGWLCALLLLSNRSGITLEPAGDSGSAIGLSEVSHSFLDDSFSPDALRTTLTRRLFMSEGAYVPAHRTIAEYLAARWLSQRIGQHKLSSKRLAALMMTPDGYLVGNLRGLAGWLAAMSAPMRRLVFEADPSAVLDYGDLSLLSSSDKCALIAQLERNPKTHRDHTYWKQAVAYVPLVQVDTHDFVVSWLERLSLSTTVSTGQHTVADVLLAALWHLPATGQWERVLLSLVKNSELGQSVRSMALQALIRHRSSHAVLVDVLESIHLEKVADSGGRLYNALLVALYPEHLPPSSLFRYLKATHREAGMDLVPMFWGYHIQRLTPPNLLLELMQAIEQAQKDGVFARENFRYVSHGLRGLTDLIVEAIERHGHEVPVERLAVWHWLCADREVSLHRHLDGQARERVRSWLKSHPTQIKRVMEYLVDTGRSSWEAQNRFLLNDLPPDMGVFWLQQLKRLDHQNRETQAVECLKTVRWWLEQPNGGINLDDLAAAVAHRPALEAALSASLVSDLSDNNWQRKHWRNQQRELAEQSKEREATEKHRLHLLSHLDDVQSGKLWDYLHDAASYDLREAGYVSSGNLPIADWRQVHPELEEATREGYRSILMQLTSVQAQKAIKAHRNKQMLGFELPCLMAAEQLFTEDPQSFLGLREDQLQAITQIFLLHHTNEAAWFIALVSRDAKWVSGLWWEQCEAGMRASKGIRIPRLHLLKREETLRPVAQHILPLIFQKWPSKFDDDSFPEFLQVMDCLMHVCAPQEVSEQLKMRLSRKALDSRQIACIAMYGLWVNHAQFFAVVEDLTQAKRVEPKEFLGGLRHLCRHDGPSFFPSWTAPTIGLLCRLFGPLCSPSYPQGAHWVSDTDEGRRFLFQILAMLREDTSEDATRELQALRSDVNLEQWWPHLEESIVRQGMARAEKMFKQPSPQQVGLALQHKTPANAADLMAIALDSLGQLQDEIDNHATSVVNNFWTVDSNGQRPHPPHRPENICRDVIAQWLTPRLSALSVTVLPEVQHGDQNRSDLGLLVHSAGDSEILLPIEVKGDWHSELLDAAQRQLAQQYATDPRCHAQGIYLVLWLGDNRGKAKKPKRHLRQPIKSAVNLRKHLQERAQQETSGLNIQVVVLDISIPI